MDENYLYSGKYYSYRKKIMSKEIIHHKWQQRYLFACFHLFTIIILNTFLLEVPLQYFFIRNHLMELPIVQLIYVLYPPTITIIIMGLTVITAIKIIQLNKIGHARMKSLRLPWVIGEIENGYLIENFNRERKAIDCQVAKMIIEELKNIPGFEETAKDLLHIESTSNMYKDLGKSKKLPQLLAVLEIMREQYQIGNTAFFENTNHLAYYKTVNHF